METMITQYGMSEELDMVALETICDEELIQTSLTAAIIGDPLITVKLRRSKDKLFLSL